MLMLDELRQAATPWVDRVMKDLWISIKAELRNTHGDDGSMLEKSRFVHFPKSDSLKDGALVGPTESEILWFETIMRYHSDRGYCKLANSQIKLWAHDELGYIELTKLFCNGLGTHEACKMKQRVEDLDAEAVFKIIYNCKAFHDGIENSQVKTAANEAGVVRNMLFHSPTTFLSEEQFTIAIKHLSALEKVLMCKVPGLVDSRKSIISKITWTQFNLCDMNYNEAIQLHKRITELRNKQLQHDILDQLLPPQPHTYGSRQRFLQTSSDAVAKLQKDWAPGSREVLKKSVISLAQTDSFLVNIWLHAQRGRGKSSLMAQLALPSAWNAHTCVLRHFFKRGDPTSSLNVALVTMCVQLWSYFCKDDFVTAYDLFDKNLFETDGCSIDISELKATLNLQPVRNITDKVLIPLLTKIDNAQFSSADSTIVMLFDALDEVTIWENCQRDEHSDPIDVCSHCDPHEVYLKEVLQPIQALSLKKTRLSMITSSTHNCPPTLGIKAIAVDTSNYFGSEDALLIVRHKVTSSWPDCRFIESLCTALCKLPHGDSLDLRFLDARCKLVIDQTKRQFSNHGSCSDPIIESFLGEIVQQTGTMALAEIVQFYVFQQMLYALPHEKDIEQWQQGVELAFETMVMAAVLGVDSFSTELFHPCVCRFSSTPDPKPMHSIDEYDNLLKELLSPILDSRQVEYRIIHLQPDYMDAIRTFETFSENVMKMMALVVPKDSLSSSSDTLYDRYMHQCFPAMITCLSKTSNLANRGIQVLERVICVDHFISLFNCAIRGASPFMICELFKRITVTRSIGLTPVAFQLNLCYRACDALENALTSRPKCGIWIHGSLECFNLICRAAQSTCEKCYSQQHVLFFKSELVAFSRISAFIHRHSQIQCRDEVDYLEDSTYYGIPTHIMTWARICHHSGHAELHPDVAKIFSPVDRFNISLLVQRFSCHIQTGLGPKTAIEWMDEILSRTLIWNETTWSILLGLPFGPVGIIRVLLEMKLKGAQLNDSHWAQCFGCLFARSSFSKKSDKLLCELQARGLILGKYMWHYKISRCRGDSVRDTFRSMREQGIQPIQQSWAELIRNAPDFLHKESVIQEMLTLGIVPMVSVWNKVIRSCGTLDDKVRMVHLMTQHGVQINYKSISALFHDPKWKPTKKEVLRFLQTSVDMCGISIYQKIAWPLFMYSCTTKADREKLVANMISTGMQPTLVFPHTPSLLSFAEAEEFLDIMVAAGVHTTANDWDYVIQQAPFDRSRLEMKMAAIGVLPLSITDASEERAMPSSCMRRTLRKEMHKGLGEIRGVEGKQCFSKILLECLKSSNPCEENQGLPLQVCVVV